MSESLWVVPGVLMAVAAVAALLLVQLDESVDRSTGAIGFTGGPDSARSILSTIASSVLVLTAIVFSITILALQLTSSQFSPRALRTFLRDHQTQFSLGVFLATFVFALLALRSVRGEDGLTDRFVPGLTVTLAFVLALASLVTFVHHIHHVAQSIRAVNIIGRIAGETRVVIDALFPRDGAPDDVAIRDESRPPARRVVPAPRPGVVAYVALDSLVALAERSGTVVEVVPAIGDFVPEGAPLFRVHGRDGDGDDGPGTGGDVDLDAELTGAVLLATERTMRQDPAYGLRQLVDIAERALSPGINDPSTAVQCLDQLHDLLRRLGTRPLPDGRRADGEGRLRVVVRWPSWEDYVHLALDEIGHWGADSLQVQARVRALLDDLLLAVPFERRAPLTEQLRRFDGEGPDRAAGGRSPRAG